MGKIRVLVIDDSALVREVISTIVAQDPALEVVGTAPDPVIAWEKIKRATPDVLTLDVEMPRMDGLTFLEKLIAHHPIPTVMVSSLTERGAETTLRALELGAVDFVEKPKVDLRSGLTELQRALTTKIKAAARAHVRRHTAAATRPAAPRPRLGLGVKGTHRVIVIGASTGGTEALREVLVALPADAPGIAVVQHMPELFTHAFAKRLDGLCHVRVKEAQHGDTILPGHVVIAPGNHHLRIARSGARYVAEVFEGAPVNGFRPSVDVLFNSAARHVGRNAVGVLLTGMGDDGARGLAALRAAGAHTIAQDEASSVVWGMPKAAIDLGAASEVSALPRVADAILRAAAA